MTLAELGLTAALERTYAELLAPGHVAGRVTRVDRGVAHVHTDAGDRAARIPGQFLKRDPPATGDWITVDDARSIISAILPRKSVLRRRAAGRRVEAQIVATNVDTALVLVGLDGDFNLRRIERYLTLVHESGAVPVVLLTKAGLVEGAEARALDLRRAIPGVSVVPIDVVLGVNAEAAHDFVRAGVTAALLGSSGAGKSTLVNYLLCAEVARTAAVRERDDRGKHTTSRRELFRVPAGGVVIDTPGMRELGLWADDEEALFEAFPDIADLVASCKFTDCRHEHEPGCAVAHAGESGALDAGRLASFLSLSTEIRERESRGPASRGRGKPPSRR